MAPRANWKGYLRLSLVSCPIALYPASSLSEKVSFNRINRKTGNRLKQQNVDSETGEVVSRDDMVRGYEVAKGQYMIVQDDRMLSAIRQGVKEAGEVEGRNVAIKARPMVASTGCQDWPLSWWPTRWP